MAKSISHLEQFILPFFVCLHAMLHMHVSSCICVSDTYPLAKLKERGVSLLCVFFLGTGGGE